MVILKHTCIAWQHEFQPRMFLEERLSNSPLDDWSGTPPAPPLLEHFYENSQESIPGPRIEIDSFRLREYCASGRETVQLGPCSSRFLKCMGMTTTFDEKHCPLEHVRRVK